MCLVEEPFAVPVRLIPVRLIPVRLIPVRLVPVRLIPVRLVPVRLIPVRLRDVGTARGRDEAEARLERLVRLADHILRVGGPVERLLRPNDRDTVRALVGEALVQDEPLDSDRA